jgi:hypothetical protein
VYEIDDKIDSNEKLIEREGEYNGNLAQVLINIEVIINDKVLVDGDTPNRNEVEYKVECEELPQPQDQANERRFQIRMRHGVSPLKLIKSL